MRSLTEKENMMLVDLNFLIELLLAPKQCLVSVLFSLNKSKCWPDIFGEGLCCTVFKQLKGLS